MHMAGILESRLVACWYYESRNGELGMNELPAPSTTHDVGVVIPVNTKYISRNPISRHLIAGFMRALIELAALIRPRTALDIGCGEGLVIRQHHVVWQNANFYGVDIDVELLQVARQVAPSARYTGASIYRMPFQTGACDVVICTEVLEHIDRPDAALAECERVSGGYCLLSVPNEPWWRVANMMRASYLAHWGNTPGHVNHWSAREFVEFADTRLEIVDVRQPFPWTVVLGRKRR